MPKTDEQLAAEVWARLRGVSAPLGAHLAGQFSVKSLVLGEVPAPALRALRGPSGRPLGAQALASLEGLRRGELAEEVRVLAGVPGFSPAMAKELLTSQGQLGRYLAPDPPPLCRATVPQKGRRVALGPARAERALRVLGYRGPSGEARDGGPDSGAPVAAGAVEAGAAGAGTSGAEGPGPWAADRGAA